MSEGQSYQAIASTPDEHLGVMVRLKLERLAAARMVVSTPQIAARDARAASGKESVG